MAVETLTESKPEQMQRLAGYIVGYQATWIADIGLKAGLFRAIAKAGSAGIGDEDLARECGYSTRYVGVWCRAAYAFELIELDEAARYRLTPEMAALLLDASDPRFIGGRMQFYAAPQEDFRALPSHLPSGETSARRAERRPAMRTESSGGPSRRTYPSSGPTSWSWPSTSRPPRRWG
jgi:hypothetical protein